MHPDGILAVMDAPSSDPILSLNPQASEADSEFERSTQN